MNKNNEIKELLTADIASAVNSILRIISTVIIYIFHCNAQYKIESKDSLFYAFTFFLFISGYYSFFQGKSPNQWIIKRLKRIYIPYWIVIIGAIVANYIFQYKNIGIKELFFAVTGGNLFIEHKIYVISWFISVIICLYICVYIYKAINNIIIKSLLLSLIALLLLKFNIPYDFFISFSLGYFTHSYISRNKIEYKKITGNSTYINVFIFIFRPLFFIQNYSYEFFLVHGGMILFITKVLHASYTTSMFGGIIFSFLGAIVLKFFTRKIDLFFRKDVTDFKSTLNVPS